MSDNIKIIKHNETTKTYEYVNVNHRSTQIRQYITGKQNQDGNYPINTHYKRSSTALRNFIC